MPANTSPIFTITPRNDGVQFANADGTTKKTLLTGGTFGTRVEGISVTSNDTVTVNIAMYLTVGGTDYYIGNIVLPAGSGYTSVNRVDAASILAVGGLEAIILAPGVVLKANAVAAVASGKVVDILVTSGDF